MNMNTVSYSYRNVNIKIRQVERPCCSGFPVVSYELSGAFSPWSSGVLEYWNNAGSWYGMCSPIKSEECGMQNDFSSVAALYSFFPVTRQ